ncbi:MAG: hypothetical protein AAF598_04265 [Bacteroidota bacterium]
MRFIALFLLTGLLAFALDLFLPWWAVAIAGFAPALFLRLKGALPHFLAAFLGAGLVWTILSILSFYGDGHIIASRMAKLFSLTSGFYLTILAGLIAGFTAGFAAVTGFTFLELINASSTEKATTSRA